MKTVIVADDHPFSLSGTVEFINSIGYTVVGSFNIGNACLYGIQHLNPDFAVIDINMPGISGLEILEKVKENPKIKTKIIMLTMHSEYSVYNHAIHLGCVGYLLKDSAHLELKTALKSAQEGRFFSSPRVTKNLIVDQVKEGQNSAIEQLSPTERKIIELVKQQKSNQEMADFLFISIKTVESHKRNIVEKLNLPKERNALLVWAIQNLS